MGIIGLSNFNGLNCLDLNRVEQSNLPGGYGDDDDDDDGDDYIHKIIWIKYDYVDEVRGIMNLDEFYVNRRDYLG